MTAIRIRIDFDNDRRIDHGRIELLELIGERGSIMKAAKAMNMSYKRAWYMIDEFNAMFSEPLIQRRRGFSAGAEISPFGAEMVREYREMEIKLTRACAKSLALIERHLARIQEPRKNAGAGGAKAEQGNAEVADLGANPKSLPNVQDDRCPPKRGTNKRKSSGRTQRRGHHP